MTDQNGMTLRAYFEALFEERDKRYEQRFHDMNVATEKALSATQTATAAALAERDKAIAKAEAAQADYNVRSNEFRGTLTDQARMFIPRSEVEVMTKGLELRLAEINKAFDLRVLEIVKTWEERIQAIKDNVSQLQRIGTGVIAAKDQRAATSLQTHWIVATLIALGGFIVGGVGLVLAFTR